MFQSDEVVIKSDVLKIIKNGNATDMVCYKSPEAAKLKQPH